MDALNNTTQKAHRPSRTKKKKKQKASSSKKTAVAKPAAFARRLKYTADRSEKRLPNPTAPLSRPQADSAPRVVAVVGPTATGKSTIIRNLIRHYTKRHVAKITGPITVVTGRRKRITFIEVGGDLSSMIDVAKVADLVLLVIDASFGFEMDTFEFLNILAAHGMPKVIGVLTHLDNIREGKQARRTKKMLKNRIWAELYDGAKVFYLSGITPSGDYLKREVLNLARFISVAKFPTLRWRAEHPYVLADRVEDITPKSLPATADRTIAAYGYVRGAALRVTPEGWKVHLAGVGDLLADNVEVVPDPCPMPEDTVDEQGKKKARKIGGKDRVIYAPMAPEVDGIAYDRDAIYIQLQKENVRFSSNKDLVGDFEDDGDSDGEGELMVKSLQKDGVEAVDEGLRKVELRLLEGGKGIVSGDFRGGIARRPAVFGRGSDGDSEDGSDAESEEGSDAEREAGSDTGSEAGSDSESDEGSHEGSRSEDISDSSSEAESQRVGDRNHDESEDRGNDGKTGEESDSCENSSDWEENGEEAAKRWKDMMLDSAAKNLQTQVSASKVLAQYIYKKDDKGEYIGLRHQEETASDDEKGDGDDTFFRVKRRERVDVKDVDGKGLFSDAVLDDMTRLLPQSARNWIGDDELCKRLKQKRFGTGQKAQKNGGEGSEAEEPDDKSVDGDFEDLETGEVHRARAQEDQDRDSADDASDIDDLDDADSEEDTPPRGKRRGKKFEDGSEEEDSEEDENDPSGGISRAGSRRRSDRLPDPRKLEQERLEKVRAEELGGLDAETRIALEGILPGRYVRFELQEVPVEFMRYFDPEHPIVVGGLKASESDGKTFLRARVRRHRFKRGVLKSADPVVFSVGWRRFQSVPIYDTEDQGGRHRYLKYTPEYLHCNATFWAPNVPPGTGVIMCQSLGRNKKGFRIAGSGVVTEVSTKFDIVKKLKLIGEPVKVLKNTAFIKGMFNSELEASKYIGASLRTVSGIRGTIKKTISEATKRGSSDRDIAKSPAGTFRAGFEDKILLSDVVFLRAWVPVDAPKFCSMATTLLDKRSAGDGKAAWRMRTVREIREEGQLPIPLNNDSLYKAVDRVAPHFAPLKIPKKLESNLPYASKPKNFIAKKVKKPVSGRKADVSKERAVVLDSKERSEQKLLQAVYTIRNDRTKRRKEANKVRLAKRQKEAEKEAAKHERSAAERRKRKFALEGAKENRNFKRQKGGDDDA
eukprot:GFKZ01001368.1.p1 GENE.GFKZ01001368.1~~GFKZ01001368.1.p1  ORF type:complete len:1237 (-),score=272.55 GFKZ01001368.1:738-4382(-)